MTKEDMTKEAYEALLDSIIDIVKKNGMVASTMDSIASSLQMSKRTLYEIFNNKEEMINKVLDGYHLRMAKRHKEIAEASANEIEAILEIFVYARDEIAKMNANFYNDMDYYYSQAKLNSRETQFTYLQNMVNLIKTGMTKGYFRTDINYLLHFRMMILQMESLKKMEETFPPDISLLDVYDAGCLGFLRGIASYKGLRILDKLLEKHPELTRPSRSINQNNQT